MNLREANYAEIKAVLRAQDARMTFNAVARAVQELLPADGPQPVRVEAEVTISSEYDDEGYFDLHTLERFEVFDADHNLLPILDLETNEELTLDDLIEGPLSGLEVGILEFFETGRGKCLINLLEPPAPPVTFWLEVPDAALTVKLEAA